MTEKWGGVHKDLSEWKLKLRSEADTMNLVYKNVKPISLINDSNFSWVEVFV